MTPSVELRRICVFCGSSSGHDPRFRRAAEDLARLLTSHGIDLVYGGGDVGLMGAVADATMALGGEVIGVIPRGLFEREVAHRDITQLVEVDSMHERKLQMYELSDAFVALPGGLGTLEELAEIATWAQLGLHAKPIAVVDVDGFFEGLLTFLDRAVADGFLRPSNRALIRRAAAVADVVDVLRQPPPATEAKWIDEEAT